MERGEPGMRNLFDEEIHQNHVYNFGPEYVEELRQVFGFSHNRN